MTTKISEANIQDATLENLLNSGGPKISAVIVTNSSYNDLNDTGVISRSLTICSMSV